MKKTLFLMLMMLWSFSKASTADLFRYDASRVAKVFVNADALDHYVSIHRGSTLTLPDALPMLQNYEAENINLFNKGPESLFGIPPFWWGFLLSWVGILLVYILTEHNKEFTKDALIGCIVGSLLYSGLWFGWGCLWSAVP